MNEEKRTLVRVALSLAISVPLLSACGSVGDTEAVKEAGELAIACNPREALEAIDRAEAGGGFSAEFADLERVVILRDAGRTSEADAALADRNQRVGADAAAAAEAEQSVTKAVEEMRAKREERTGRRTCP